MARDWIVISSLFMLPSSIKNQNKIKQNIVHNLHLISIDEEIKIEIAKVIVN